MSEKYTEEALVKGIKEANNQILTYLYKNNYPKAIKMAKRLSDRNLDNKDLFHEALITLIENVRHRKFKAESRVETYLMSIYKFKLYQILKKGSQTVELSQDYAEVDRIDVVAEDSTLERLNKYLSQISQDCLKLLEGFYYRNLSMKDLAEEYNYSPGFVRVKKLRCMKKLKMIISKK